MYVYDDHEVLIYDCTAVNPWQCRIGWRYTPKTQDTRHDLTKFKSAKIVQSQLLGIWMEQVSSPSSSWLPLQITISNIGCYLTFRGKIIIGNGCSAMGFRGVDDGEDDANELVGWTTKMSTIEFGTRVLHIPCSIYLDTKIPVFVFSVVQTCDALSSAKCEQKVILWIMVSAD